MPGYRPPIIEAQAQLTAVRELMLFSLSWRCLLLPFNPSARRRRVAELQVLMMCRNNEQTPPPPKKVPKRDEVVLSASVRQMGCVPFWLIKTTDIGARGGGGISRQGGDGAKTEPRLAHVVKCMGAAGVVVLVGGGGRRRRRRRERKRSSQHFL